jgi:hypothetical protein
MKLDEQFASKKERLFIMLTVLWGIVWTLYANQSLERICPLESGSFILCGIQNVDLVWSESAWQDYWLGLIIPPLSVLLGSKAIAWIKEGR